jgi:hypothetical protein
MTVYVGIILLPTSSHDQTKKAFDWVNNMLTKSWYCINCFTMGQRRGDGQRMVVRFKRFSCISLQIWIQINATWQ